MWKEWMAGYRAWDHFLSLMREENGGGELARLVEPTGQTKALTLLGASKGTSGEIFQRREERRARNIGKFKGEKKAKTPKGRAKPPTIYLFTHKGRGEASGRLGKTTNTLRAFQSPRVRGREGQCGEGRQRDTAC